MRKYGINIFKIKKNNFSDFDFIDPAKYTFLRHPLLEWYVLVSM